MKNLVFVFGSNLSGIHGKGAALYAKKHFGAKQGEGAGRTGNAYALPTKDFVLKSLSLDAIGRHLQDLVDYATENSEDLFLLTPIGTGLAGYTKSQIWSLLKKLELPSNLVLTSSWIKD